MTQHTPGPWHTTKARTLLHIAGDSPVCEISVSANHVHEDYPGAKRDYIARQEANAEFIVRACNAHAELLAALEELAENRDDDYLHADDRAMLRAAIAKARGE